MKEIGRISRLIKAVLGRRTALLALIILVLSLLYFEFQQVKAGDLNFWESFEAFGFKLVIVGVCGESAELVVKLTRRATFRMAFGGRARRIFIWLSTCIEPRLLACETCFFILLVIGLGMEFLGSQQAKGILHRESDQLERDAFKANREASLANERGKTNELRVEELRRTNLELERIIAPRSLTLEQQHRISDVLKPFEGKTVVVMSYVLDVEAIPISLQIISALTNAGIKLIDQRASLQVFGGFEIGINVRGKPSEKAFARGISEALSAIGNLQSSGNQAEFVAPAAIGTTSFPPEAHASIMIGVKPPPNNAK